MSRSMPHCFRLTSIALAVLASGCAVGPTYVRPSAPTSATYKEAAGWVVAAPADALDRGAWWALFDDPLLNELEQQVEVSNQNVAAATAAYAQAQALVREQRASLFPVVSLNGGASRSGGGASRDATQLKIDIGGSWEPDVWAGCAAA